MKLKRGQVSTEYIIIIGVILFLLIPFVYFAIKETSDNIRINNAETAVKLIKEASEKVYALGPGNKETVSITLPTGVSSFIVGNNEILLTLQIRAGVYDFSQLVKASFSTTQSILPQSQGTFTIKVEAIDSGPEIGKVKLSY